MSVFPDPAPPAVDCPEATGVCDYDVIEERGFCNDRCDLETPNSCGARTCLFDTRGQGISRCAPTQTVVSGAMHGEPCATPMGLQGYCNVVDGSARGYCDYEDTCQPLCESDADCEPFGLTCQSWLFEGGAGYCGDIPTDG